MKATHPLIRLASLLVILLLLAWVAVAALQAREWVILGAYGCAVLLCVFHIADVLEGWE